MPETLRPGNLKPGHHVIEAYDGEDNLIVRDLRMASSDDIERLIDLGVKRVTIEDSGETSRPDPTHQKAPDSDQLSEQLKAEPNLVRKTERLYRHTVTKVKDIFFSADRAEDIDPDELVPFVEKVLEFAEESPGSLSVLTQVEDLDFDTFRHSVNLGILSILYARHRDYDDEEIREIALGAMLHDIGKIKIPEDIILKEGELTHEEYEVVQTHTTRGYELLLELGMGEPITNIALEHHERPDGFGYPDGTDQIHPYSRVISVLDVYDAMTSKRVYSDEVEPSKAFSVLRSEFGDHPETRSTLYDLLRCLGLYPVGSLVKLTTGELAFVQRNRPGDLKHPDVSVVVDRDGNSLDEPFLLNLNQLQSTKTMIREEFYDSSTEVERVLSLDEIPILESDDMIEAIEHVGL